ncbi:MAG: molybdopterin-dependent oxidoreductase [Bacteriovoracaceae bacterium]|nr:molybdopterin-dependent oxidoreductase [Bacteriovoracaceae bacterium]
MDQVNLQDRELKPLRGLPSWGGKAFARWILKLLSMEEQPLSDQDQYISPIKGYFRRDRYFQPKLSAQSYSLEINSPHQSKSFSLEELKKLPQKKIVCVQECAGNGNHLMGSAGLVGHCLWEGPTVQSVLEHYPDIQQTPYLVFRGLDNLGGIKKGYHYGLSIEEVINGKGIIALKMNGEELSRRHGFPARLVVPRIYSMSHVKWLSEIELVKEPHSGIYNTKIYVNKEFQDGKWVNVQARWIDLKSYITRCEPLGDGSFRLSGFAWGGEESISRVEISTDHGVSWTNAELTTAELPSSLKEIEGVEYFGSWQCFSTVWRPEAGRYTIGSRAYSSSGQAQPLTQPENVKGHFNQCQIMWRKVDI